MSTPNYFEALTTIDVTGKTEKKGGLTYLSWAWAWGELKKKYPQSYYTIYENDKGWPYHSDGRTCWVKTGVTVVVNNDNGDKLELEHIEYLPVMDFKNNSMPVDKVTSVDANRSIQRSLTKACARHGIGLNIYAGEDYNDWTNTPVAKPRPSTETDKRRVRAADFCKANNLTNAQFNTLVKELQADPKMPQGAIAEMNNNDFDYVMGTLATKAAMKGTLA